MVLDYCARDYELVSIRVFKDNDENEKSFTEIGLLAEALELCIDLNVDVVSLSAVSSILSDSKYLYDITHKLALSTVIISALDNKQYITLPTSYPHVIGVSNDMYRLLKPGEIAYSLDDPLGVNVYANCSFPFLSELKRNPSNSFAVPVVAAYVNDLLNNGFAIREVPALLGALPLYCVTKEADAILSALPGPERDLPAVFISGESTECCRFIMDALFDRYEVQSAALSHIDGRYDVRISAVNRVSNIRKELRFMERHYKTDLIFIIGGLAVLDEIREMIEIDVTLIKQSDDKTLLKYDEIDEMIPDQDVTDRMYQILAEYKTNPRKKQNKPRKNTK